VHDFSQPEDGEALYATGAKAFRDYSPVTYSPTLGVYRSVRWGRNLELFFLDERSFRSAEAAAACAGDLAPMAPQSVRAALATLAPTLATPVSEPCLATLDDPGRTMLGAAQYAAFTQAIQASSATFKVVVNEVPIQQLYAMPYDRWEGYVADRDRLLQFLQANVRNVAFLSADVHATLVGDVRYQTLGGPATSSGMWEVTTGPVAAPTFAEEFDALVHRKGASGLLGSAFLKPAPPSGLGLRCAALDSPSYAEVTVTSRTLTIAPKDSRGKPVRDVTGTPCAPLVVPAQ
jgi:phosphodiesterase/alkaline phosphatase D-like protein